MTRPRVPRRSYPPISDNDLEEIKRKVLLQFELIAEDILRSEKSLAFARKERALIEAYWDSQDKISLEIDDLVARARRKRGEATQ